MLFGLIGEKLGHSFSKVIHERIGGYEYKLIELEKEQLDTFMMEKNFKAINVTIPYKQDVIKYLDYISEEAKKIGSVNTIVNIDGKLHGYNTDYYGLKEMIEYFKFEVSNKNVMILGTGGTSKTAFNVIKDLNAKSITLVSRRESEEYISYDKIKTVSNNVDLLINTTPVEMYPNNNQEILTNLDDFASLSGVIDVIYNPLKTNLILKAQEKKINSCNGLFMLIAQAVYAIEIFLNKKIDKQIIVDTYLSMLNEKQNIVLIGMPGSGKSTIGKLLKNKTGRRLIDTDKEIVSIINMPIKDYFEKYGEKAFRKIESDVIKEVSSLTNVIIATGGGSILNKDNVRYLKQNGKVFFLDRAVKNLKATSSRPLSSSADDLKKRYDERYPLYISSCDVRLNCNIPKYIIVNNIINKL